MYDIIGDIHGHADELLQLLELSAIRLLRSGQSARPLERPEYFTFAQYRSLLSLTEFSRDTSGRRSLKAVLEGTDRLNGGDRDADGENGFCVRVPEIENANWETLSITLDRNEAEFLRTQMTASVQNSLLGQILRHDRLIGQHPPSRSDS